MTQCPQCGLKSGSPECPNCGYRLTPDQKASGGSSPEDYFRDFKSILLSPSRFFKNLPLQGGVSRPLTFALVAHWLGSACTYLWLLLTGGAISKMASHFAIHLSETSSIDSPARMNQWLNLQQKMSHWATEWLLGTGSVILDPFKTLIAIFFTSLFVFVGARLFVNSARQTEVTYESAIRLVAYAMTPAIIAVLPFAGGFAAAFYVLVVTIIGAREMYRISTGRAVLVALFPKLLFLGIIALGAFALFFGALQFLFTAVHFQ